MQVVQAPLSSWHSNEEPGSSAVNAIAAVVLLVVPVGPAMTDVLGAVRSTVHVMVAGVGSVFPAGSMARTARVCSPLVSDVRFAGDEQVVQLALSSWHWNVEAASSAANENDAVVEFVAPKVPETDVVGGTRSMIHVVLAGVGSVLPAASVARTWTVCSPASKALRVVGVEQGAQRPLSSWQSNVPPGSLELNEIEALVEFVGFAGPAVIVVAGAVRSTTHVAVAGVASVFPAMSVALTEKLCGPLAREFRVWGEVHVIHAVLSSWHSNVELFSSAAKVMEAPVACVEPVGALIEVLGATMSSVVRSSTAPTSQALCWGRGMPRWSVVGQAPTSASNPGLDPAMSRVSVGPPWSARLPRRGSVFERSAGPRLQLLPLSILEPVVCTVP